MAAPLIPNNIAAQSGNGIVYLSWNISTGATSYVIKRSLDNVTFSTLTTITETNYSDDTVSLNTEYFYTIAASNGTDTSFDSSSVKVIPTIAGVESLYSLRLQAKQQADMVNSNFITDTEWNLYLNSSINELYDLLITAYEDYYMAEPYTFITDGQTNKYALPNGVTVDVNSIQTKPFYKLLGVDIGIANNNNARVTLHKYDFIERNRYVYPNVTSTYFGVFNLRYRVMGSNLTFIPTPSAGQYITVYYIPRHEKLVADTDITDSISGWTEYVIVDAAIKAKQKQEEDVSVLMARKQALIKRIEEAAENRDAGQPDTISDSRGNTGKGSWGMSDGGFGGY